MPGFHYPCGTCLSAEACVQQCGCWTVPEGDGQARVGDDAPVGDLALLVDHALAVDDALALVVGDLLEKGRSWASSRPSLLLFIAAPPL